MKPTLNEQLARMQKLAGIIKENQVSEVTGIDAVDYTVRILNKFKRSVPFDATTILKKAESLKNYIESQYDTEEIGVEMAYTEIDDMIDAVNNGDDIMSVIDTAIANLNLPCVGYFIVSYKFCVLRYCCVCFWIKLSMMAVFCKYNFSP